MPYVKIFTKDLTKCVFKYAKKVKVDKKITELRERLEELI
tara:strand:- start:351 stop:470 length:120 start_codon:yes stop_codon:yes gene_type:complete